MYVIYPADEVVYLSYGRLMYVPLAPQPNQSQQQEEPPVPEDPPQVPTTPAPSVATKSKSRKSTGSDQSRTSSIDRPGTSGYNSLDRPKRSSVESVPKSKPKLPPIQIGSLERSKTTRTPEGVLSTGSNKSSKSSKQSSGSSKSRSQTGASKEKLAVEASSSTVRPRTFSDTRTIKTAPKIDKLSSNSFRSTLSTPEHTPVRPERKRERPPPGPSPSSEHLRVEIPRSDIINTRSDRCENVRCEKPPVKREKSPVLRFFRAQSSSPRSAGRDKPSSFDFDVSGRTFNSAGVRLKPKVGSDSNLLTGKSALSSGERSRVC
ncbi:unnamed protein product [Acanthoscelides obtectus]|uniref:Uncharacterized protein n=1 Tax=Acanthoscelides obtectus TaxID=200917 RepID=A0A9P0PFY2_ACAOB|nr:unnamed protein product [Acanthoscelides obtectus]CAK1624728.1 hypothetical protein AOBTE_LOCUS2728 [Acanthoscelides obtectus]